MASNAALAAAPRAAKFLGLETLDRDYLVLRFSEGEVVFAEDAPGYKPDYTNEFAASDNRVVSYGPLDLKSATDPKTWIVSSKEASAYSGAGKPAAAVYRKTKIAGMAQLDWDTAKNDFRYEAPLGHVLYLRLPEPLEAGKRYVLRSKRALGVENVEFRFDPERSATEAIHVNLAGYPTGVPLLACDLYHWMGDGGARDYASFEDSRVFLVDVSTGEAVEAGRVARGAKRAKERSAEFPGYDLTGSADWIADFASPAKPGRYRVSIEGVGASREFRIGPGAYRDPFAVSLRGFYYMRVGEPASGRVSPVPRQPSLVPDGSAGGARILVTSMSPSHPEWKTFAPGDPWDPAERWVKYVKPGEPENKNARGGHADALDWDRHLGHVSIIYDLLLPYYVTRGSPGDDDTGIAESGNGVPDLIDEARNEVDFWLSLRVGDGYSPGLTNPDKRKVMYQADATTLAAWANAANAAMLASCLGIAGEADLRDRYLAEARKAWAYAESCPDRELDGVQNVGDTAMRGADFRMTAAAYLFDLTGERAFEEAVAAHARAADGKTDPVSLASDQGWATAGYLFSARKPSIPGLKEAMAASVIKAAKAQAAFASRRASRRTTDPATWYFQTEQNVHRIILAHALLSPGEERDGLLRALLLEADWGLGRNPLNMIQMTTAGTPLSGFRSVENAYTSGRRDGTPGLHPGHTPYLNVDDWGSMTMAKPGWMAARGYPAHASWPRAELYFNTRWVWAHSEFTPQQTMRGKMALYAYLRALGL